MEITRPRQGRTSARSGGLASPGHVAFSDGERQQLDAWIAGLEAPGARLERRLQGRAYAAIGHLQLRLGRWPGAGRHWIRPAPSWPRIRGHRSFTAAPFVCIAWGKPRPAQEALKDGDAALRKELPGPVEQISRFEPIPLALDHCFCHGVLLRQEAEAELGSVGAKL